MSNYTRTTAFCLLARGAQSELHTRLPREEADRLGAQLANRLLEDDHLNQASQRYQTEDALDIGAAAAREYLRLSNRA